MTRSDILKKYLPPEITLACRKLMRRSGKEIDWSYLTNETADKVAGEIERIRKEK